MQNTRRVKRSFRFIATRSSMRVISSYTTALSLTTLLLIIQVQVLLLLTSNCLFNLPSKASSFVFPVLPGTKRIIDRGGAFSRTAERTGVIAKKIRKTPSPKVSTISAIQQQQEQEQEQKKKKSSSNNYEYERLRFEAERIRLEAEKLDADLTLQKISTLEGKLSNDAWLEKQNGQTVKDLYEELRRLQSKIERGSTTNAEVQKRSGDEIPAAPISSTSTSNERGGDLDDVEDGRNNKVLSSNKENDNSVSEKKKNNRNLPPISGFDDADLDLYVPIANDVTRMAPNATLEERMKLFRDAPELQEHFKAKIQAMLLGPLEEMQELESLKQKYFDSSSSKERAALLKQIKRLEKKQDESNNVAGVGDSSVNNDESSGIGYSDSIKIPTDALPPLPEDELQLRYETIKSLPDILVAVYLQRNGLYDTTYELSTIDVNIGREGTGFNLSISDTASSSSTIVNNDKNKKNDEKKDGTESNGLSIGGGDGRQSATVTDTGSDTSFDLYENLKLAIQLDYYDLQIQLLLQARSIEPMTDEIRTEFTSAFRSLPVDVRKRFVTELLRIDTLSDATLTSESDDDVDNIVDEILKQKQDSPFFQIGSLMDQKSKNNSVLFGKGRKNIQNQLQQSVVLPEYNDVEFVDRSRYLEEFFPAVALLENQHPSQEDVDTFVAECLTGAKNEPFMVTSKPERVIGGYYIRGTNQLLSSSSSSIEEEEDKTSPADRLVQKVTERLQNHPTLKDKIEFYYILDPSPPTDEEMELDPAPVPLFLVTAKDANTMYNLSAPLTKSLITILGLVSPFLFSIGSCVLNPKINNEIEKLIESGTGVLDIQWFFDLTLPLYFSILGILLAHEIGHRIAAYYHKFEIGLPNIIPSLTTGIAGAITPIKSPPPNNKALFDFSFAGPISGLSVSLVLLFVGLQLTQQMSLDSNLPVLPVDLVRASSLGGGMSQYFLGKYALLPDQGSDAFIELHPFAISGLIGCFVNALALLPLGHTDGGRISLAMFGRRGAFVNKLFATLILCVSGLIGLDNENILILYVVFTLAWQRELESPIRNEVDELDFARGLMGISSAILVLLILIPMTT